MKESFNGAAEGFILNKCITDVTFGIKNGYTPPVRVFRSLVS